MKKGDIIVRLSNSSLDLQILDAEAQLAEKQNFLRNTQVTMEQDKLNNQLEKAQLDMETTRQKRITNWRRRSSTSSSSGCDRTPSRAPSRWKRWR